MHCGTKSLKPPDSNTYETSAAQSLRDMTKAISTTDVHPSTIAVDARPLTALSKSMSCAVVTELCNEPRSCSSLLPKSASTYAYDTLDRPRGWYVTRKTYRSVAYRTWTVGNARKLLSSHSDYQLIASTASDGSDHSKDSPECSFEDKMTMSCIETSTGLTSALLGHESWRAISEVDDDELQLFAAARPIDAGKQRRNGCRNGGFLFFRGTSLFRRSATSVNGKPPRHPNANRVSLKQSISSGSTISSNTSYDSIESVGDFYSADDYQKFQEKQTRKQQQLLEKPTSHEANGVKPRNGHCNQKLENGCVNNDNAEFRPRNGLRKELSISSIHRAICHFTGGGTATTPRQQQPVQSPISDGLLSGFLTWRRNFSSRRVLVKPNHVIANGQCNGGGQKVSSTPLPRKLFVLSTTKPTNDQIDSYLPKLNGFRPKPTLTLQSMETEVSPCNENCLPKFTSYATAIEHVIQEMVHIRNRDFAILKQLCRVDEELARLRDQEGIFESFTEQTQNCALPVIPRCLQPSTTTL